MADLGQRSRSRDPQRVFGLMVVPIYLLDISDIHGEEFGISLLLTDIELFYNNGITNLVRLRVIALPLLSLSCQQSS